MSVNQTISRCGVESARRPFTFVCFSVVRLREPTAPRPLRLS